MLGMKCRITTHRITYVTTIDNCSLIKPFYVSILTCICNATRRTSKTEVSCEKQSTYTFLHDLLTAHPCIIFFSFKVTPTRCILILTIFIPTSLHVPGKYVLIIRITYFTVLEFFTLYGWLSVGPVAQSV